MLDSKISYKLRTCWFDDIEDFSPEEYGDLMGAIVDYHFGRPHDFTQRAAQVAFRNIARTWESDERRDADLQRSRAEAGRRGAANRWGGGDDDCVGGVGCGFVSPENSVCCGVGYAGDVSSNDVENGKAMANDSKAMAKNGKAIFCHSPEMANDGKCVSVDGKRWRPLYKEEDSKGKDILPPKAPLLAKNVKKGTRSKGSKVGSGKSCVGRTPPRESSGIERPAPIAGAPDGAVITPAQDGETHIGFAENSPIVAAESDAGSACADVPAVSVDTGDSITQSPNGSPDSGRTEGDSAECVPPTWLAWKTHAEQIGWKAENKVKAAVEIEAAYLYWQKVGWTTGTRKIRDWRACCADSKIRADSKAGRLPASIIDDVVDSSVAPQFWKLELANLRHVNLDDFAKLRWRDYVGVADKNEVRDVVARCLVYPENEKFLK